MTGIEPTHVALLRGINVGGRNKLPMVDLRSVVADLGHSGVSTYIQSGNAIFTAADPAATEDDLAEGLEAALSARLGRAVPVVVLSAGRLRSVVEENPFAREPSPKAVHAVFRRGDGGPDPQVVTAALDRARARGSRDEAVVVGTTLYLWTPDGMGRSQLAVELGRARRGGLQDGTARNWATVMALLGMLGG